MKQSSVISFDGIQVKIAPRERIFQQRHTSVKNTDRLINPPRCFYHADDEITFFCKNRKLSFIKSTMYVTTVPKMSEHSSLGTSEQKGNSNGECNNIQRMQRVRINTIKINPIQSQKRKFLFKKKIHNEQFQTKLRKYKQSLFESIESTLIRLKDELYAIDKRNSVSAIKQVSQAFERISQQGSLTDIIRCYEHYYEKSGQKSLESAQNKEYSESIIEKIKFVVDQKQLAKVVEKGLINSSLVQQQVKVQPQRAKINCQQYLRQQGDSPWNPNTMKSPISQLNQLHDISMQDLKSMQQHVTWQQNAPITEFPISQMQVTEVKRQERRSIFKQKEQREMASLVSKAISFNEVNSSQDVKKSLQRETLFSNVKQYKIENESEDGKIGKRNDSHAISLKFQKNTILAETPHASRTYSNSSMKSRGKGLSLVKGQPLQEINQIRQIQRQTTINPKNRLKSQTNLRQEKQVSFSRQSLGDWKRVVNLTDSNASSSRQSKLSYHRQNYHAKKNQGSFMKTDLQGFQQFKGIDEADVLNPMEMRQLIMRKRNANSKAVENTKYVM